VKRIVKEVLYAKSGKAITEIAGEFLNATIGDKVPTINELEKKYEFYSHGTIQNALTALKNMGAISLKSLGKKGNFLEDKDDGLLLKFMGVDTIVGCMPLPYSRRLEGFATGLLSCLNEHDDIESRLVYTRGAESRVKMLLAGKCDYVIVSKFAALEMVKEYEDIEIIKEFGYESYVSDHVVLFHDVKANKISDGMRVGIDEASIDQKRLTELICKDKNVTLVPLTYNNILKKVISGEIDCAVWNKDEIFDKYVNVNYSTIDKDIDDTIAVMMCDKRREYLSKFLDNNFKEAEILKTQKLVLDNIIVPIY